MFSEQGGSSTYSGTGSYGQVNIICLIHQKLKLAVLVLNVDWVLYFSYSEVTTMEMPLYFLFLFPFIYPFTTLNVSKMEGR